MTILQGRILITDYKIKEERDAVIKNILNNRSSRAALYIMVMDFKDILPLLKKFPTVIPFTLDPMKDIQVTRKLLELLPHMDHVVNFLGQQVALEILGRCDDLRIKDISLTYAKTILVDKMLESNGERIIFNINTDHNLTDVIAPAKKSVQSAVKKIFSSSSKRTPDESSEEKQTLLQHQEENDNEKPSMGASNRQPNIYWNFLIYLFHLCCPCVSRKIVKLPVEKYPLDLDDKMMNAFTELHNLLGVKWLKKLSKAEKDKSEALKQLQDRKEKLKQKELSRLRISTNDLSTISDPNVAKHVIESNEKANLANASLNVRDISAVKKREIQEMYSSNLHLLYDREYYIIIEQQILTLKSVWNQIRLGV